MACLLRRLNHNYTFWMDVFVHQCELLKLCMLPMFWPGLCGLQKWWFFLIRLLSSCHILKHLHVKWLHQDDMIILCRSTISRDLRIYSWDSSSTQSRNLGKIFLEYQLYNTVKSNMKYLGSQRIHRLLKVFLIYRNCKIKIEQK